MKQMSNINYPFDNTHLVIDEVYHYHFFQSINHSSLRSTKYEPRKRIIPTVPRQHSKAPVNSPLSFIRQQKLPQRNHPSTSPRSSLAIPFFLDLLSSSSSSSIKTSVICSAENTTKSIQQQRSNILAHSSADLLNNLVSSPTMRQRKVSFNENVMVICTQFIDDDDDMDDGPTSTLAHQHLYNQ